MQQTNQSDVQKEFENYFDLFNHKGWKQLIEELTTQKTMLDAVLDVKDIDDLRVKQGQLYILNNLLSFDTSIENQYKMWEKDEDN